MGPLSTAPAAPVGEHDEGATPLRPRLERFAGPEDGLGRRCCGEAHLLAGVGEGVAAAPEGSAPWLDHDVLQGYPAGVEAPLRLRRGRLPSVRRDPRTSLATRAGPPTPRRQASWRSQLDLVRHGALKSTRRERVASRRRAGSRERKIRPSSTATATGGARRIMDPCDRSVARRALPPPGRAPAFGSAAPRRRAPHRGDSPCRRWACRDDRPRRSEDVRWPRTSRGRPSVSSPCARPREGPGSAWSTGGPPRRGPRKSIPLEEAADGGGLRFRLGEASDRTGLFGAPRSSFVRQPGSGPLSQNCGPATGGGAAGLAAPPRLAGLARSASARSPRRWPRASASGSRRAAPGVGVLERRGRTT